MKTEYVQTNFAEITPTIRESFRIRGRARGVNLIPLALGEQPPEAEPEQVESETDDEPLRSDWLDG